MTCNAVLEHLLGGLEYLLDLDVLANAPQHLVGTRFHADEQPAQAGLLAARPYCVRKANALIGAHGGSPGDLHPGFDDSIGQRLYATGLGEKCFVLKIDIIEMVSIPQLLQSHCHAYGLESDPLASINERVRAECAAEITPLRRDVIELPLALEIEITLYRNQSIVVRPKLVDLRQRPSRVFLNGAVAEPHRAPGAIIQRPTLRKALYDLGECLLALSAHRDIDRALRQALAGKHGWMPASPDYRQIRSRSLRRTRYAQGIGNRSAGEHGNSEAQGLIQV